MIKFDVVIASEKHIKFAEEICEVMADSAKKRGTGIARRTPEYIAKKMTEGKAVIALANGEKFAGFCYIEVWGNKKFAANSGLIIAEDYRKMGLAKKVKAKAFELSRKSFPASKLFGLTTSLAVMKINSDLGYRPVTFSELTDDEEFWKGCQSCVNYDILTRTERKHCLCTGMLFDPNEKNRPQKKLQDIKEKYENWLNTKKELLKNKFKK